jgi:CheY-like chemotaxis protein
MSETDNAADARRANFKGLQVLVAEDEILIFFLLEQMLEELGCGEVHHASRVSDALTQLQTFKPNVAILDCNLAGENADKIAEALDAMQVPFVFATGYGRGGISDRWASAPVVQKPFDLPSLSDALNRAIKR